MEETEEKNVVFASGSEGFESGVGAVDVEKDFADPFAEEPVGSDGSDDPADVVMPVEAGLYEYDKVSVDALVSRSALSILKEVFLSREAAVDALSFIGREVVVSYRAEAVASVDMRKLEAKIADVKAQMEKFLKEKTVLSFQAKTIGCKKCGSQLAKEYLKDDCCPLCGNDLRAPSTIAGEADYRQRIASMEMELEDLAVLNQVRNGKVCYLLKVV